MDKTLIVSILDRSGSMSTMIDDAIGGFNTFIEEQKKLDGEAIMHTVLFDTEFITFHNMENLKVVEPFDKTTWVPRGGTALYDAIGRTLDTIGTKLKDMDKVDKPQKIMMVILTDGMENASQKYEKDQIFDRISVLIDQYNWEIHYLGANQDAMKVGIGMGVTAMNTSSYDNTGKAMRSVMTEHSVNTSSYRKSSSNVKYDDEDEKSSPSA